MAWRRRGARPVPQGSDDALARRPWLDDRLAYCAEIARRQLVAGDDFAELGHGQPAHLQMLRADGHLRRALELTGKCQDAHEAAGQHLEQMLVEQSADLDLEPRLLAHLALERGAMILARIGPAAGQIPFAALVQEQQDTSAVD